MTQGFVKKNSLNTVQFENMTRMYSGEVTVTGGDTTVDLPFDWTGGFIWLLHSASATEWTDATGNSMGSFASYDSLTNSNYTNYQLIQTQTAAPFFNAVAKTYNDRGIIQSATPTSFTINNPSGTQYVKYFVWAPYTETLTMTNDGIQQTEVPYMTRMCSGLTTVTGGSGDVTVNLPFDWTGGHLQAFISNDSTKWLSSTGTVQIYDASYDSLTNSAYSGGNQIFSHDITDGASHHLVQKTSNWPGQPKSATSTSITFEDDGATTVYIKYFVWAPYTAKLMVQADKQLMLNGAGAPEGITPNAIGDQYIDTSNGKLWYAVGTTTSDWINTNGQRTGGILIPGYVYSYWKLDHISGNAVDYRGNQILNQYGTVPNVNGKFGNGKGPFSTSNYYGVDSGGSSSTVFDTNNFFAECWIRSTGFSGSNEVIFGKNNGTTRTAGWGFHVIGSSQKIEFRAGNSWALLSDSAALDDGNWHYLAFGNRAISGANEGRCFVDGTEQSSTATGASWAKTTADLIIGGGDQVGAVVGAATVIEIDDCVYWSSVPSSWTDIQQYVTDRWNSGARKQYS